MHDFTQKDGFYTDCFAVEIDADVQFAEYIAAFYSTKLFKLERLLLRIMASARSSDQDAIRLGFGEIDKFAVWRCAKRAENQLLMETRGRTKSWFMIEDPGHYGRPKTRLLFGSVVAPLNAAGRGKPKMGLLFSAVLGAHTLYSKALLTAARARLQARNEGGKGQGAP